MHIILFSHYMSSPSTINYKEINSQETHHQFGERKLQFYMLYNENNVGISIVNYINLTNNLNKLHLYIKEKNTEIINNKWNYIIN